LSRDEWRGATEEENPTSLLTGRVDNVEPTSSANHMTTSNKTLLIKSAAVRKLIKSYGKRTSAEFLAQLDRYLAAKIEDACKEHNGGKKTLDAALAAYMLGNR
jgi:hypothetical protein